MGLIILSAVGLPFMALLFFAILEAAFSTRGLWEVLSNAGLDLCRISIGIAGAVFLDAQHATATLAMFILFSELIVVAVAMLVDKRAADLGITQQSSKAFGILGLGIVSMAIPAVMVVMNGGR